MEYPISQILSTKTIMQVAAHKKRVYLGTASKNCNSGDPDSGNPERVFKEEKESGASEDKKPRGLFVKSCLVRTDWS